MAGASATELARIRSLLAAGETRQALAASSQLVEAAKGDPDALRLQAACLEAAGVWERAVFAHRNLVARCPDDPGVAFGLAAALLATGDAEATLAVLAREPARSGDPGVVLGLRARALTLIGDLDAAVAVRREQAGARPGDPSAGAELARALARTGAFAEADRVLDQTGPPEPVLAAAAEEIAARRGGPAALSAWWDAAAAGGILAPELVVPYLRELRSLGRHEDLLAHIGQLRAPPALAALVPLAADAIAALAARAAESSALRESLAQAGHTPSVVWSRVVNHLIQESAFDAARALMAALPERPDIDRLRVRLAGILTALPRDRELPDELRVGDSERSRVFIDRRPEACGTVIVLGDRASRLLHPAFVERGLDLIHLRDVAGVSFLGGVPELGPDWPSMVKSLRALVRPSAPLFTVGTSGGAYAAVRLGLELNAQGVLALAPPSDLRERMITEDAWGLSKLSRVAREFPELVGDLRAILLAAPAPPRVHLWHAADHARDSRHAQHLVDVPCVTVHRVAGVGRHHVLLDMIGDGLLDGALDELLDGPAAS